MKDGLYFCVMVLRHWDSMTANGITLGGPIDSPGCIGFMPIFDTKQAAEAWRDEFHPEASVAAIPDTRVPA